MALFTGEGYSRHFIFVNETADSSLFTISLSDGITGTFRQPHVKLLKGLGSCYSIFDNCIH
ncbi:hypothetical protein SB8_03530 [Pseudomonas oryzihabitans]|nr:hypothetical protein SB8_03530 [Pseudomonas psychrotolerans]